MDTQLWAKHAQHLDWMTPWHTVQSGNFTEGNIRWFEGGELNVSVNCVDRHFPQHADKTALIWEADEPGHNQSLTFAQLHERVCRFANILKAQGIQKGDRVCIYLPMIFEGVIAMLACARIGAVHSAVFGGFAPESIASRIQDAECCAVITVDTAYRSRKKIAFKANVDKALTHCPSVKSVIVVKHTVKDINWQDERDIDYADAVKQVSADCPDDSMQPFLGIEPVLLDTDNTPLEGEAEGALCIKNPWPGMMCTIYGDHQRFIDTYLAPYPGHYFSGDGACRDADGDLWITGRMDDVLNVSGHRLGTTELESALVTHPDVAEAAIIGVPHPIKGEGIYAFITLGPDAQPSDDLAKTLNKLVRDAIGPIVSLDHVQWTAGVPKTRSGKIMRRLLRKIATSQHDQLGDTSTLANPDCIDELIKGAQN